MWPPFVLVLYMGWKTVIIGCESVVSLSQNRIRISVDDDYHLIPINDIDTVIFTHDKMRITIPLIVKLMENNVNIVICDSKNNPIGTFNCFNGHSLVFKHLKKQIEWRCVRKKKLWKNIIDNKIQTEIDILELLNKDKEIIRSLKELKSEIKNDDQTNREAIAARIYFCELFGNKFRRDDATITNHALDYGYKIIASYISKCLVSRGYLTQLGIHHIGESNPFNLTYDFIEPFRAIIDAWVYCNIKNKFLSEEKQQIVQILEYKVFVNNKWFRISDAIEDVIDSYIAFLNDENDNIILLDLSKGIRDD